jgi:TnpA family transposase
VWTYGIQLWECTKQSNIDIIERFQNRVLRNIVDALLYIRNGDLHRDLQMEMVMNEIGKFAKKHEEKLLHRVNVKAIQLVDNSELVRRLKKKKEKKTKQNMFCLIQYKFLT